MTRSEFLIAIAFLELEVACWSAIALLSVLRNCTVEDAKAMMKELGEMIGFWSDRTCFTPSLPLQSLPRIRAKVKEFKVRPPLVLDDD